MRKTTDGMDSQKYLYFLGGDEFRVFLELTWSGGVYGLLGVITSDYRVLWRLLMALIHRV